MAHPQIAAFARLAKGGDAPNRLIAGQATKLSRTMHDIRYDEVNDEFLVGNPFAQSILVFRGGAVGEEAPIRIIQGSRTLLQKPDNLEIDTVHNEIYVPEREAILVFPREANGDVAPIRVLRGSENHWTAGGIAADPVHNVLVGSGSYGTGRDRMAALLIFNRTDDGQVKPRAVIGGPKSGLMGTRQIQIYPKGGWIIVSHPGRGDAENRENIFIGVWSVNDSGDVPPRWKIGGPSSTLKNPRGVVLNPKNKELIVADMRGNSVLTYYFPEIF